MISMHDSPGWECHENYGPPSKGPPDQALIQAPKYFVTGAIFTPDQAFTLLVHIEPGDKASLKVKKVKAS